MQPKLLAAVCAGSEVLLPILCPAVILALVYLPHLVDIVSSFLESNFVERKVFQAVLLAGVGLLADVGEDQMTVAIVVVPIGRLRVLVHDAVVCAGCVGMAHRAVLVVLYEIVHEARLLELRLRARSSSRLTSLFLLVLEYSKAILDLWALILVITEAQLGLIIVHHVLTSALKGALRALP